MALFYANCEENGTLVTSQDDEYVFNKNVDSALKVLSHEDKMTLLASTQKDYLAWKKEKVLIKEKFETVKDQMPDAEWKDYVMKFKARGKHNGIVGDYIMSKDELMYESKKLGSIIDVIRMS